MPWILSLLVLGPIAGMLTGSLVAADSSGQATLLVCTTPAAGVLAGLGVLALALVAGLAGSRINGSRSGLTAMGVVLAWGAWGTTTIDWVLRLAQSGSPLTMLAIEGLVFGLLLVPVGLFVWQAGLGRGQHGAFHPLPDGTPGLLGWLRGSPRVGGEMVDETHSLLAGVFMALTTPAGLAGIGITLGAGVLVTHLIAQEPFKGQAIFAAAVTFLLAVPVAKLVGESLKATVPMASFFIAGALLGAIGPLAARMFHGEHLIEDLYSGHLLGLAVPVSLDWLAGACLGIPMGLGWFYSMFAQQEALAAAASR